MNKIIITGGNGQLSYDLKKLKEIDNLDLVFFSKEELDITDYKKSLEIIKDIKPELIINTAAYTFVDKAEENKKKAFDTNVIGAKNLSLICSDFRIRLLHISTDYVFDGIKKFPYDETDKPNPLNYYGKTKLEGEQIILKHHFDSTIIRAGWLFGYYGNNFVKTIINLSKKKKVIQVVNDQIGIPTPTSCFANDLLEISEKLINFSHDSLNGIFHYACSPDTTWFSFANKIIDIYYKNNQSNKPKIIPVKTDEYKFLAKRPKYTVMNSNKICDKFELSVNKWEKELYTLVKKL